MKKGRTVYGSEMFMGMCCKPDLSYEETGRTQIGKIVTGRTQRVLSCRDLVLWHAMAEIHQDTQQGNDAREQESHEEKLSSRPKPQEHASEKAFERDLTVENKIHVGNIDSGEQQMQQQQQIDSSMNRGMDTAEKGSTYAFPNAFSIGVQHYPLIGIAIFTLLALVFAERFAKRTLLKRRERQRRFAGREVELVEERTRNVNQLNSDRNEHEKDLGETISPKRLEKSSYGENSNESHRRRVVMRQQAEMDRLVRARAEEEAALARQRQKIIEEKRIQKEEEQKRKDLEVAERRKRDEERRAKIEEEAEEVGRKKNHCALLSTGTWQQ